MSFQFVNANGEPLSIAALKAKHQPKKAMKQAATKVTDRDEAKLSLGFVASGFSQERIAEAKQAHEKDIADAHAWNKKHPDKLVKVPAAWDEEAYMRKAKPTKARAKPYDLESAADQCAEMLRAAGWKGVRVEELLRA